MMDCGGVCVEMVTSEELEEGIVMRDLQVECAEVRVNVEEVGECMGM